jgi:hypothetical protein
MWSTAVPKSYWWLAFLLFYAALCHSVIAPRVIVTTNQTAQTVFGESIRA